MNQCLFCLEDITTTDKLGQLAFCNCKVCLHANCLEQIQSSGLLCPICRIKNSRKYKYQTSNLPSNSILEFYSRKIFDYFVEQPNVFRFMLYFTACFMVMFCLVPHLLWLGLKDSRYRTSSLIFIVSCCVFSICIYYLVITSIY